MRKLAVLVLAVVCASSALAQTPFTDTATKITVTALTSESHTYGADLSTATNFDEPNPAYTALVATNGHNLVSVKGNVFRSVTSGDTVVFSALSPSGQNLPVTQITGPISSCTQDSATSMTVTTSNTLGSFWANPAEQSFYVGVTQSVIVFTNLAPGDSCAGVISFAYKYTITDTYTLYRFKGTGLP